MRLLPKGPDMGAGWLGRCTTCGGGVWKGDAPYRPDGEGFEHEVCFAQRAVNALINDFTGRKGLAEAWAEIDEDVRLEIRSEWVHLILTPRS